MVDPEKTTVFFKKKKEKTVEIEPVKEEVKEKPKNDYSDKKNITTLN